MRFFILIALVLLGCSADHGPDQPAPDSVESPDGGSDAGDEPVPIDDAPVPVARTSRWAIYRGTEETYPDFSDGNSGAEVVLAVWIDPEADAPATPRALPGSTQLWGHKWSSDGAWLVELSERNVVSLWDMTSDELAEPKRVSVEEDLYIMEVVPSPAGARFILAVADGAELSYRVLDAQSGTLQPLAIESASRQVTPQWAPTGEALLILNTYATGFEQLALLELDAPSRPAVPLVPPSGDWATTTWSPDARWITAESSSFAEGFTLFLVDTADGRGALPAAPWRARHDETVLGEADRVLGWSPNGAWMLLLSSLEGVQYEAELQLIDMRGAEPSEPIVPANQPVLGQVGVRAASWAPDSRRVALVRTKLAPNQTSNIVELLVFDATQPEVGLLLQHDLSSDIATFVAWTAEGAIVFQEDERLFIDAFEDEGGPAEIADDVRLDVGFADAPPVSISPDGRTLLYVSDSSGGAATLITLEGTFEHRAIAFGSALADGLPQWLPDSSGLVALTNPGSVECHHSCRLEYLMLDAAGHPQRPFALAGQAHHAGPELQP